jgi:hypothetical protein
MVLIWVKRYKRKYGIIKRGKYIISLMRLGPRAQKHASHALHAPIAFPMATLLAAPSHAHTSSSPATPSAHAPDHSTP